jgi:hypothetical protein
MQWGDYCFFRNSHYYSNVAIELTSPDGEHFFHSSYEYEFVVVDGERCGKAPALYAWYDRGAFIWNAVEGRELVVYKYVLD